MTDTEKKIIDEYQKGKYSIIDIARLNNVEVDEVLRLTGNEDIMHVTFVGDQIDDAGPDATVNKQGRTFKQEFSKN